MVAVLALLASPTLAPVASAQDPTPTPTPTATSTELSTPGTPPVDLPDTAVGTGTQDEGLSLATTPPAGWPEVPRATARSILAVDTTTGQVLAAVDVDDRVQVASTIKLLTVLTALELMDPEDEVTAGPEAELGGSTAAVDPGDTWTVRDLVAGALVRSGNDAAEVLAVAGGDGDRAAFIEAMNDLAASLGITGATIADPSGLEDVNLLSARDLVTIGRAALADPLVAEIAASRTWDLPSTGVVPNRNLLLEQREDATGLKTGTTDLAGASLVASVRDVGAASPDEGGDDEDAAQGGADSESTPHDLVVALLGTRNDSQRYDETNAIYDWIDTALARHPVELGARVRLPGTWVGEVVDLDLWSPDVPVVDTDVAVDGTSVVSEVSVGTGGRLGEYVATEPAFEATSAGQSLTAVLYDGMRQAHELGQFGPALADLGRD